VQIEHPEKQNDEGVCDGQDDAGRRNALEQPADYFLPDE